VPFSPRGDVGELHATFLWPTWWGAGRGCLRGARFGSPRARPPSLNLIWAVQPCFTLISCCWQAGLDWVALMEVLTDLPSRIERAQGAQAALAQGVFFSTLTFAGGVCSVTA
jgi:hypothetical protein